MKNSGRRLWCLVGAGVAAASLLAGCEGESPSSFVPKRTDSVAENTSNALALAKAYDRLAIAQRNGDDESILAAQEGIISLGTTGSPAEKLVRSGILLDTLAMQNQGASRKKWEERATEKYRAAQKQQAHFTSSDHELLNALGYFLADRGDKPQDFVEAERLTRAALVQIDKKIKAEKTDSQQQKLLRLSRATGAQDSLAWALFKQEKYDAALKEQLQAVKISEELAPLLEEKISADLYYHLGEIYQALQKFDAAREQFEKALQVEPDHEGAGRAVNGIDV